MFWKSANSFFSKTGSITSRLTVFYSISTIALLTAVCIFFYWAMIKITYKGDYTFLSDEMDLVQEVVATHSDDFSLLKEHVIDIPHALSGSIYKFYIWIMDENGNEIISTPGSNEIFSKKNRAVRNADPLIRKNDWLKSNSGEDFLLIQTTIPLKNNSLQARTIQIALNISYQHKLISNYRDSEYLKFIIVILLIGGICAIFIGYAIARRNIKRLYDIANTTKKISASSIDQRLNINLWPKELNDLGVSFNLMLDRIECSFSRLKQFSADLAHEICTPINNLMGQTEIILSRKHPVDDYQQVLESNLEELHRISQIIENILFLASTEDITQDLKKELLNTHEEITAVSDYYQVMADEKNIKIFCIGNALLQFNPIMFRRMISNLLSNAINYTLAGGNINFKIKNIDENFIEIAITDSGIGIAPEHLMKISGRFYRVNADRSLQTGGVGLGLAIVKSIVELHRGTIAIISELQKGTTITLTFPR